MLPEVKKPRDIPARVDVVVIGGGITGCSVLYHLAKAGCRNALLLERHQISSGTTWHSAAQVVPLRSWEPGTELAKCSMRLYASLEAETGQATGWRQCGHLNLAASRDRLTHLKHTVSIARAMGLEAELIGPSDVQKKWPLLRTDDLFGAVWAPFAGRVNPTDVCQALLKGARTAGAHYLENTSVTGFDIVDRRLRGVRTSVGTIQCDAAVNCAGVWGRQLGIAAGVSVPLYACEHFYFLTEPIKGVTPDLPILRDSDACLYIREEVGGLLVGCFEPNPRALPIERLPKDASFILLNEDWDHIEPMMVNAINRVPALNTAGTRILVNGPESFTIDHNPIMGEAAEVRGYFVACGMNSTGVALAGGVGYAMAEWILKGRPSIDLWPADIRRYVPFQNNERALSERIPEVLGNHLNVPWPGHDYSTVRNFRRTPFHSALKAHGAYFTQRGGWERAAWFYPDGTPPEVVPSFGRQNWFHLWAAEHRAAREEIAIFDQSPFSKLLVQGCHAERFLQRMCANDVGTAAGKVVYTALLNEHGGIESDLTVTRLNETTYLLVTGSLQGRRDTNWLTRHISDEEHVAVTDVTSAYGVLGVTGPRSRDLLSRLTTADLSNANFPFGTAKEIEIGYAIATALRISYAGELGWELYIPCDLAADVFEQIKNASEGLGLRPAGVYALGSLRIEKGFRSWGHDIGPADTPIEAGLMFAVRLEKPTEFLGKDGLLHQQAKGIRRRLISFVFDSPEAFPHGHEPIYRDGRLCGMLSSASYGHTVGRAVALGWVNNGPLDDISLTGGNFEVEIADERYVVKASPQAPYDPHGRRVRM